MDYLVTFEDADYELPEYNFDIADKLENIQATSKTKDKCKKIYDLADKVILKGGAKELFGMFKNADPNRLQIFFDAVYSCYNKPVAESRMNEISETIESLNLDKVSAFLQNLEKAAQTK